MVLFVMVGSGIAGEPLAASADAAFVRSRYAKLPMRFEVNEGQTDPQVKFLARGDGYALFLTSNEAVLALKRDVVRFRLAEANPDPVVRPIDRLPGTTHYFVGADPRRWRTNVPGYAKVRYENVYRGIDVLYYGNQSRVEYDFVVAPGADPNAIAFDVSGADGLELDADGDLLLRVAGGRLDLKKPLAYQTHDRARSEVESEYVLTGGSRIGVRVGSYDRTRPLLIDPLLVYSTYLGGSNVDLATEIAVDGSGNAFVTGATGSADFPTTGGPGFAGGSDGQPLGIPIDAFVTKINSNGSGLIYSVYLGGSGNESGFGIAVDGAGQAYVTGGTSSTDFPHTPGAFQPSYGGGNRDAFVARLNADGSLGYSTFLGGSCTDEANSIAVDGLGRAFVTGQTEDSAEDPTCAAIPFPTTPLAYQTTHRRGIGDAFVTKLNSTGSALEYSTLLGGTGNDNAFGIGIDALGNAHVTGVTDSTDFPTMNAIQSDFGVIARSSRDSTPPVRDSSTRPISAEPAVPWVVGSLRMRRETRSWPV